MLARWSVTGLATDVDFRPPGIVCVGLGVVATAHIGRMTLGAHQVPILVAPRRVQWIVGHVALVGIHRKPAFASCIPCDGGHLQTAAGESDEVLLEG